MFIKRLVISRVSLVVSAVLLVSTFMPEFAPFYTAAQTQESSELFVKVDKNKDLTPEQEARLAQIKSQPTSADTRLVTIRTELLTPSPLSLMVNVGPNRKFQLLTTETRPQEAGLTWIGKPLAPSDSAVLINNNGNVTGTVRTGNELYAVRPLGGGLHVVVRQDQNKFPPEHPPEFEPLEKEAPKEFARLNTADESDAPKVLRVLVAYTPRVAAAFIDVDSFINLAIAETNHSYTNSLINIRAELAYAHRVNYRESASHDTDLSNFRENNDSVMDEVHHLRDTYRADVCVLLIDNNAYCGMARVMATESSAFAVVHYTCATGNYSFQHEIGHLQGARHNKEADPEMTPFSYGHGHYNQVKKWRTIMSYDCTAGCPRIPYWSNPNVKYKGDVTGTDDECNNARVLNETASTVTSFRN